LKLHVFVGECHIGEVISLIKAIASQTTLFASKSDDRGRRTGESGRGFAVVATDSMMRVTAGR
jgi:hypothetical protein